jgi:hypothetical protein
MTTNPLYGKNLPQSPEQIAYSAAQDELTAATENFKTMQSVAQKAGTNDPAVQEALSNAESKFTNAVNKAADAKKAYQASLKNPKVTSSTGSTTVPEEFEDPGILTFEGERPNPLFGSQAPTTESVASPELEAAQQALKDVSTRYWSESGRAMKLTGEAKKLIRAGGDPEKISQLQAEAVQAAKNADALEPEKTAAAQRVQQAQQTAQTGRTVSATT